MLISGMSVHQRRNTTKENLTTELLHQLLRIITPQLRPVSIVGEMIILESYKNAKGASPELSIYSSTILPIGQSSAHKTSRESHTWPTSGYYDWFRSHLCTRKSRWRPICLPFRTVSYTCWFSECTGHGQHLLIRFFIDLSSSWCNSLLRATPLNWLANTRFVKWSHMKSKRNCWGDTKELLIRKHQKWIEILKLKLKPNRKKLGN